MHGSHTQATLSIYMVVMGMNVEGHTHVVTIALQGMLHAGKLASQRVQCVHGTAAFFLVFQGMKLTVKGAPGEAPGCRWVLQRHPSHAAQHQRDHQEAHSCSEGSRDHIVDSQR